MESEEKRTCIFIVGKEHGGKTTLIGNLTGHKGEGLFKIDAPDGRKLNALVISVSLSETKSPPAPTQFPEALEKELGVKREDYDLLICASRTWMQKYPLSAYIEKAMNAFKVEIAIIETTWKNEKTNIKKALETCKALGKSPLLLDVSKGYDSESEKIRQAFYPRATQ